MAYMKKVKQAFLRKGKVNLFFQGLLFFLLFFQNSGIVGVNLIQSGNEPLSPIYVVQEDKGILRLVSVSPTNGKTKLIYTGALEKGLPIFRKQNYILFKTRSELFLLNLTSGKGKTIVGSKDAFPGNSGFFRGKPWLLFSRKTNERWETVVFDYEKEKEVSVTPGLQPFISADQNYVYLVGNEVKYSEHGEDSTRVPIHKFSTETGIITTLAWIETGKEKLQILDVYSLIDDLVVIRAATEKENKLYILGASQGELVKLDRPFYPPKTDGNSKEQFSLSVGTDGKSVAFTERSEGKSSYIVVVDLIAKRRFESSYLGSFPIVKNGYAYFLGDPHIVNGSKDGEYKPYTSFTLYALDYKKDQIRVIAPLYGKAELLE